MRKIKKIVALLLVLCSMCAFCACAKNGTVFTAGLGANDIFKIGNERADKTEFLLYVANIANQYEKVYGSSLWELHEQDGTTMAEKCKNLALAQLAQVKTMKLLAKEKEVVLTEEEKEIVLTAAKEYIATLSAAEKESFGITDENLVVDQLYEEKLLADKLYAFLIKDVNPEISDDEARIITVQHILLKTYTTDENGNRQEFDAKTCANIKERAEEIQKEAASGENFEMLISKYNEDSKSTYSFGHGDMEEAFEKEAYELATDEISRVICTSQGYHILKCISTLDREQTNLNKEKILISRKQEVFGETYNQFAQGLKKEVNNELLQSVSLPDISVVDTSEFFRIYEEKLGTIYK